MTRGKAERRENRRGKNREGEEAETIERQSIADAEDQSRAQRQCRCGNEEEEEEENGDDDCEHVKVCATTAATLVMGTRE